MEVDSESLHSQRRRKQIGVVRPGACEVNE